MALNFRTLKGSAFTHQEVDNNFNALVNSSSIHEGGKQIKLYTGMNSGSFSGTTSSYNLNAYTASHALFAVSASHEIVTETFSLTATSASHAVRADIAESVTSASFATFANSSKTSETSTSASFATFANDSTLAETATNAINAITASIAISATSASFATFANSSTTSETSNTASFISDTFISSSAVRSGFGSGGSSVSASYASTASYFGEGLVTASAAGSIITFTKDNGTNFNVIIATGSIESASYASTASFVSDTFISASAVRSGFGSGGSSVSASFATFANSTTTSETATSASFATFANNTTLAETASYLESGGNNIISCFDGFDTVTLTGSELTFNRINNTAASSVTIPTGSSSISASFATFANSSTTSETSTSSSFATFANSSTTSETSTNAITASIATSASFATFANNTTLAETATNATSASFATFANNTTLAETATNATSASFATFANSSTTAATATSATTASLAELSNYTTQWALGADGSSNYTFNGPGLTGAENDPTLYLIRGQKYKFINGMGAHPFRIQSTVNGSAGTAYNDGITNNNVSNGTLTWDVQFDSPAVLYYQCTSHNNMGGAIYIGNANTTATSASFASFANNTTLAETASFISDSFISASAVRSGFGSGGGGGDTDLGKTLASSSVTVTSSTGDNVEITSATINAAGVMSTANLIKLNNIEASADVTDVANVTAAGALMDSELTSIADVKALNQSLVTSASPSFAGLTIAGDITANKIITSYVTSSVALTTGSSKFGDEQSDKHMFTGSVDITGSIVATNLSGTNTGNETTSTINALDITEVGTISSGVWNGTAINQSYLTGQSGTNTGDEPDASATVKGIVELATSAETATGTDTTRAVTPKGIKDLGLATGTLSSILINTAAGLDGAVTINGSSGTASLSLDLSELTDMTTAVNGAQDELILLDNGAERRKLVSEITLSDFSNDSGWTSNAGTVTSVSAGVGLSVSSSSPTPVIGVEYNNDINNIIFRAPDGTGNGHKIDSSDYILVNSGSDSYQTVYKKNVSDLPFTSNTGTVNTTGTVVDNDYAKFTNSDTVEGRSISQVRSDLSISNVQDVDIRTFTGSVNIVTVGAGALTANVDSIAGLGLRAHSNKLQVSSSDTITVGNAVSINLAGLPDMTQNVVLLEDELVILDNSTQKRKLISEIPVSAFNNDANYGIGSGDITGVSTGVGLTGGGGSGAVTLAVEYNNNITNVVLGAQDGVSAPKPIVNDDYILVASSSNSYEDVYKMKVSQLPFATHSPYSHPNHTGDVTSTGDGATTIGADKVTYAKMQNVSTTNRILGRDTAGAGNVEEISPASLRTMLNVADGATANTGDITAVTAGNGLSGGATSGAATVTLGAPTTLTAGTTNTVGTTTHAHAITVTTAGAASTIVSTDASQQITADNFISTSDKRLKSKIKPIQEGLETIKKFVAYEYELNGKPDAGFIAQEVQEHIPYAVSEKENGYLAMNTKPILAHLHKAILELDKRLTDIENKL